MGKVERKGSGGGSEEWKGWVPGRTEAGESVRDKRVKRSATRSKSCGVGTGMAASGRTAARGLGSGGVGV